MSSTKSCHAAVLADIAATHTAIQRAEARRSAAAAAAEAKARAKAAARAAREAAQAEINHRWAINYREEIVRRLVHNFEKKFLAERFVVLAGPRRRINICLQAYIDSSYRYILGNSYNDYIKNLVVSEIRRQLNLGYYSIHCDDIRLHRYRLPCEPPDAIDAVAYALIACIPYMCMGVGVLCEMATGKYNDRITMNLTITLD
jgi:hypothetical protein